MGYNSIVHSCIAHDNLLDGFRWWRTNSGIYCNNVAYNNTVSGYNGTYISNQSRGAKFKNNIAYGSEVANNISNTTYLDTSNNCYYNNNMIKYWCKDLITEDPELDGEYKISITSPCVGAGTPTGYSIKDIDGAPFKRTTPSIGIKERKTNRGIL